MFEKIEILIKSKNKSIYEVSTETGISQQLFSTWKKGKAKPSLSNLEKLAKYFDVPLSFFTDGFLEETKKDNFSNEDILLARELNKTDKLDLIKDIMRIKEEADVQIIKLMTEKILKTQK